MHLILIVLVLALLALAYVFRAKIDKLLGAKPPVLTVVPKTPAPKPTPTTGPSA